MDLHIIKLMIWAVATIGIYGDTNEELDNLRKQRDIIPGGTYENDDFATRPTFLDNNINKHYQTQAQLDHSNINDEWTKQPMNTFLGYTNQEDYRSYMNRIYRKDNNMGTSFKGPNNQQLNSVSNTYNRDSKPIQTTVIHDSTNEANIPNEINPAVAVPNSYQGSFGKYSPIPLSRRIIVPVPTPVPQNLQISQVPEAPYLVPYQVHHSVRYNDKVPVAAPIPVEAAVPSQYPVEVPSSDIVGIQQPIVVDSPEPYYLSRGNKDIVEYGQKFRDITPNIKTPVSDEENVRYRQPSNYYNGYQGGTDAKINSFSFASSQKPIQGPFRQYHSYYSYPSPVVSENSNVYGKSHMPHGDYFQGVRNNNLLNSKRNMGFRYGNFKPHRHLRQGKNLNRNKNFYGYVPPCFYHMRNGYSH